MQGYINIHRKIKEWQHYKEPAVKAVFLDLLLDATHKPTWQSGVRLAVGECISSTRSLAQSNGLAVNTVTKAITLLIESGEIARRRDGNITIFTILNYADYQNNSGESVANGNTPKTSVAKCDTRFQQVSQNVAHDDNEGVANDDTPVSQIVTHSVAKCDTPTHYNITNQTNITNNKENENIDESCDLRKLAVERIDEVRKQCLDDWTIEQARYKYHITEEQYKQITEEIFSDWLISLDTSKPIQPQLDGISKQHFFHVLRIKVQILNQINQQNGIKDNSTDRAIQRRGSDTKAVTTEDYETAF